MCHHPTWVDLKGKDAIPETVHHTIVRVDPTDARLARMEQALGVAVGAG